MADDAVGPFGGCPPRLCDEFGRMAHRTIEPQWGFACPARFGLHTWRAAQSPSTSPDFGRAINIRSDSGTRRFRNQPGQREGWHFDHAAPRIRAACRLRDEWTRAAMVGHGPRVDAT